MPDGRLAWLPDGNKTELDVEPESLVREIDDHAGHINRTG